MMKSASNIIKKLGLLLVLWVEIFFFVLGCHKKIDFSDDHLEKKQTVTLQLTSGRRVSGEIRDITELQIILTDEKGQTCALDRSQIINICGPEPVFDHRNRIISEREIQVHKTKNNLWLFTFSGGLISAGCGFFLSSMLARSDDNHRETIIQAGTTLLTAAGTYLFSRLGMDKDRQQAIKKIRYMRELDEYYLSEEDRKRLDSEQELKALQQERQQQEKEIELLRQQIREKDKK